MTLVLACAAPAVADEPSRGYAAEVVASDAVAIGLTIGGERTGHELVRDGGFGLGVVGAPVIHIANGNYGGAAKSLALRVTLPLALGWLADQMAPKPLCLCQDDRSIRSSHVLGFALGLAAASALDATLIAKKPAKRSGREWRPDVSFKNGGMRLSVAMKF